MAKSKYFGPALAGVAMTRFGAEALPAFQAVALVLAALIAGGRRLLRRRDNEHPSEFHVMVQTTPTAIEMLPEVETPGAATEPGSGS